VIAKWLLTDARLVCSMTRLAASTRPSRRSTRAAQLTDSGKGIVFYSTDYAELIGCCDRVVILYEGGSSGELAGGRTNRAEYCYGSAQLPESRSLWGRRPVDGLRLWLSRNGRAYSLALFLHVLHLFIKNA